MSTPDLSPYLAASRGRRAGRWSSAAEAVRDIPEGARVYVQPAAAMPLHLLDALDDERARWRSIELVMGYAVTRPAPFRHPGEPFRFTTVHATRAFAHLWDSGVVDVVPSRYSDQSRLYGPGGPLACDAALVQVSRPGPDGRVSLAPSVGGTIDVVRSAPLVVAQVNPNVPYLFGASELATEELDHLVEVDAPLLHPKLAEVVDDTSRHIAALAAEHVGDGSTIQFGVGALPDAILGALRGRRGLRVHSGLLSDACADLHDAGVVEGTMVVGEVMATPRLLRWADRNPAVFTAPAAYTHGAAVLAALPRFVALNSTVEVALDGSCNSEVVGEEVVSGPGGAPDYAFGASVGSGGRSVIALRATAGRGAISRVVRRIEAPRPVTLPAYLADILVTEHGAVEVRGLGLRARAEAIRSLAAPEHRAALA